MTDQRPQRPRVVELFAGVGGFRIGLERSGWQVVWANQWEPSTRTQHAFDCYVRQFGSSASHVNRDIYDVLEDVENGLVEIPRHELLAARFPCQDYSVATGASQANGIVGKKGVLWWQIVRLIRLRSPHYFLFENVDRLLKSPVGQRGRDFAVMLSTLATLGYEVEWRVVNAADYGFPQRRRRIFMVGRQTGSSPSDEGLVLRHGALARSFSAVPPDDATWARSFELDNDAGRLSVTFGQGGAASPFLNAGYMARHRVWTSVIEPFHLGKKATLRDCLTDSSSIPLEYYIPDGQLPSWREHKGAKRRARTHQAAGVSYYYSEGAIPFPDPIDRPARTILTSEGGRTPSRAKHVILAPDGRYRRLVPEELECLNGFPPGWTLGLSPGRRAFLMGNALVVGLVECIGQIAQLGLRGSRGKRPDTVAHALVTGLSR